MKEYVIVFLNDARVIGPFKTEKLAAKWARTVPNSLFETEDEWEHAECNGDFWFAELEKVS